MIDSGSENINCDVDGIICENFISRTIAQIEIDFSNSLIESLFYRLKHRHLFLKALTSFEILVEQTEYYLTEANNKIPLAVLKAGTPLEIISGNWTAQSQNELIKKSIQARDVLIQTHRQLACALCVG
ncbi:MAG: hypothetical protein ACOH5I_22460 [Oligoflexus sp.]